jgi:serine/threonine protein kinase
VNEPTAERLRRSLADRYRIERELGRGGMATVYLAQDLRHDRKVALKVLDPETSEVLWVLLRGRVGERLGERERALQSYAWVAGMWWNAGSELQPYAREAREGLARLTGEER